MTVLASALLIRTLRDWVARAGIPRRASRARARQGGQGPGDQSGPRPNFEAWLGMTIAERVHTLQRRSRMIPTLTVIRGRRGNSAALCFSLAVAHQVCTLASSSHCRCRSRRTDGGPTSGHQRSSRQHQAVVVADLEQPVDRVRRPCDLIPATRRAAHGPTGRLSDVLTSGRSRGATSTTLRRDDRATVACVRRAAC
jgi:hypothetical protein